MDATHRDTKQAAASVRHMSLPFKTKEKEYSQSGNLQPVRMGKHGTGTGSKPGSKPRSGSKIKEGYDEHKNQEKNREKNLENIDLNVRNLKQKQSLLKLNIGNSELNVIKIRENEGSCYRRSCMCLCVYICVCNNVCLEVHGYINLYVHICIQIYEHKHVSESLN
jgi:hypothetical protein